MGESACLMQPFSYAAPEVNSINELGQSISLGRFMSEKLDWEKWSTFTSQNGYVAEAERYSRPGLVAQKKAFFEAHYKKLAAARKAAAEALLQQENKPRPEPTQQDSTDDRSEITGGERRILAEKVSDERDKCEEFGSEINKDSTTSEKAVPKDKDFTTSEKPVPKDTDFTSKGSEEKSRLMSKNSKSRVPTMEKMQKSPKSSSCIKAYTFTSTIKKLEGFKDMKTPLRTPNRVSSPLTDSKRGEMGHDSSAKASKTVRARWNFLPTEQKLYSPSCFTPFGLRSEERAARRKKKLEEKFKQQQQQQEEEEEEETDKKKSILRRSLCFKATPLPNFYKQRLDHTQKALLHHQHSPLVESKNSRRS